MTGKEKGATRKESESKKEIESLEKTIDNLVGVRDELSNKLTKAMHENELMKKTIVELHEEIKGLKTAMNKSDLHEGSDEYVEIAAVPPVGRMQMAPIMVNGVAVPPTIDEDGFDHFVVPKKTAISLLAYPGARHVLVGPVDYIDAKVPSDRYEKNIRCLKHRKIREGASVVWVPVVVEEEKKG